MIGWGGLETSAGLADREKATAGKTGGRDGSLPERGLGGRDAPLLRLGRPRCRSFGVRTLVRPRAATPAPRVAARAAPGCTGPRSSALAPRTGSFPGPERRPRGGPGVRFPSACRAPRPGRTGHLASLLQAPRGAAFPRRGGPWGRELGCAFLRFRGPQRPAVTPGGALERSHPARTAARERRGPAAEQQRGQPGRGVRAR